MDAARRARPGAEATIAGGEVTLDTARQVRTLHLGGGTVRGASTLGRSGLMSEEWKRNVWLAIRHRQPQGPATATARLHVTAPLLDSTNGRWDERPPKRLLSNKLSGMLSGMSLRHCGTELEPGYSISLCWGTQRFEVWPWRYW